MHWKSAALALCLCAACCLASAPALGHPFFFENLLANFGAENGAASPDGMTAVPIPGWTAVGGATVVSYGTPGDFPSLSDDIPEHAGEKLFVGGPGGSVATIHQAIDVPYELWDLIDSSLGMSYTLFGWLGGYAADPDYSYVTFTLKNGTGGVVETNELPAVTLQDRDSLTSMHSRLEWGFVPQGTRLIEATVVFVRLAGSYNNACADNLEVRFHPLDSAIGWSWGALKGLYR